MEKTVSIGTKLNADLRTGLIHLLREYTDIFAWSATDMPDLLESVAMHRLDVNLKCQPVKQKQMKFALERQ